MKKMILLFSVFITFGFSIFFEKDKVLADEIVNYTTVPTNLDVISTTPFAFADGNVDFNNGYFDKNSTGYSITNSNNFSLINNDFPKFINNDIKDSIKSDVSVGGVNTFFELTFDNSLSISSFFISSYYGALSFYDDNDSLVYKSTNIKHINTSGSYYSFSNKVSIKKIRFYNSSDNGYWSYFHEFEIFEDEKVYLPVTDITAFKTDVSANLKWSLPVGVGSNLDHIKVDGIDVGKSINYTLKNLDPETEYEVNITAVYKDDIEINTIYKFKTEKESDKIPPRNVTNLKTVTTTDSVVISWSKPTDLDYEKTILYRDDVFLKTLTDETSYTDLNLKEDTLYTYKLVTVDLTGNKSIGEFVKALTKFTTVDIPPKKVVSLVGKPLSKGVRLSWKSPTDNFKGFNVYMLNSTGSGSTKVNGQLITTSSYQVSDLVNDQEYSFYVVAENSSGLTSVDSDIVTVIPTINSVPPVSLSKDKLDSNGNIVGTTGFSLKDIANGTSNWFNSFWLILAFAIGIVVAFVVANRVKRLFLN